MNNIYDKKVKFVRTFLPAMKMAYPNMKDMVYMLGSEAPDNIRPNPRIKNLNDDDEYIIVTMENDYRYYIVVTADSLQGILVDVVKAMEYK